MTIQASLHCKSCLAHFSHELSCNGGAPTAVDLRSTHSAVGRRCASAVDSSYVACAVDGPYADATGHGSFCFGGDCAPPEYNIDVALARPCGCFSPVSYIGKASIGGV
jgi:hypothetical protein